MGGEFEAWDEGVRQLGKGTFDQADHVQQVTDFVQGNLNKPEAFTGFMALFRGQYADAVNQVLEGLRAAHQGAVQRAEAFGVTADNYTTSDGRSRQGLEAFQPKVAQSSGSYAPPPGGGPALPGAVTHPAKISSKLTGALDPAKFPEGETPKFTMPSYLDQYNPTKSQGHALSPVDLANETVNMVNNGQDVGHATSDMDDYEDFEKEHGK